MNTGHNTQLSAADLDRVDPLGAIRHEFDIPEGIYLVGNSLGAIPKLAKSYVLTEMDRWATHGVEGHFSGELGWKDYHELVRSQLAALVGAHSDEVVAMNALTVNLHLLMVSFYQPTPSRHKIIIENHAFPSDHFAVESQIRQRGFDPANSLVLLTPRAGEETLRTQDILDAIAQHGSELALILLPGVQYYTGQVLPMKHIVEAGHKVGAKVGFDLAHAAGNIELSLHDWNVDFAVWCSYKYLNSGPGGVGGAFVHTKHLNDATLPKFHGWWGTNATTRFKMGTVFDAIGNADSWQLSNAPILPLATLRASLDVIDKAGGIAPMRAKSLLLFDFLLRRVQESVGELVTCITPTDPDQHGCQLALAVAGGKGRAVFEGLESARVFCDWREPNVIRVAAVPLYNSFDDVERFVTIFAELVKENLK